MDKEDYFDFNGKKIWYRLTYPSKNKKYPAILFIHGSHYFASSSKYIINRLKNDFICLIFSHLGCGKSEGKFEDYSLQSRLEQTKYIFSYLKSLPNVSEITVVGISMGCHVAARLSESERVKNLILRAPASYCKDYETRKMNPNPGWLPWDMKNKDWPWSPSFAFEAIKKYQGNLLIVKCEKDEIIPDKIINEYYKQAEKAKIKKLSVIKGATHVMSDQPELIPKFIDLIKDFLKNQ